MEVDNESWPFKKCSNFTDDQLTAIALVRGVFAAVGCVIFTVIFISLVLLSKCYYQRVCGSVAKRLVIGLTASTAFLQLLFALNLVHYYHREGVQFCKAAGYFDQYVVSIELLFMVGIILVLLFKVLKLATSWRLFDVYTFTCHSNKLEIAHFVSIFVLPLFIDWIPFTTDTYGPYGTWCWIRSLENNCSSSIAGFWEQIWLSAIPFGCLAILTIGTVMLSLFLLCYTITKTKIQKLIEVGVTDSIFFLAFLALMFILYCLVTIYSFMNDISVLTFWVLNAMSTPLTATFIPLALLTVIHLPYSSIISHGCYKYQRQDHTYGDLNRATVNCSSVMHQPSDTYWNPPHSSIEDSETTPLVGNQQQQNYGS